MALQPSKRLAFFYGAIGLFSCFCLFLLPINIIYISIFVFLVVVYISYIICLHAYLLLPWSLTALTLNAKNQWWVKNKQGKLIQVTLLPTTFVYPYFTVIHLKLEKSNPKKLNQYYSMLVIPSRVDDETFRKIRVLLRWGNFQTIDSVETLENSSS